MLCGDEHIVWALCVLCEYECSYVSVFRWGLSACRTLLVSHISHTMHNMHTTHTYTTYTTHTQHPKVINCVDQAHVSASFSRLEAAHSVCVIGGGPVGVEVVGEIAAKYPQKEVWLLCCLF